MAKLEVRHLHKDFEGRVVLQDVSLHARPGEIVSVIGPSGCGKTTLFRCILGELLPDEGEILLDGADVAHVPLEKRGIGIVYQDYALFPHLTVEQNVAYGLRARGRRGAAAKDRVKDMLALMRLEGKGPALPGHLSGGERQRVALARVLAVEPRVLLLDEAFAALDATTRSEVVQEVRDIIQRMGVTTLLVTHDQEEAFLFARRVVVLNAGRVVVEGPSEQVMSHPDPFIQSFVKMVLFTQSKVERDREGNLFATTEDGTAIPIHLSHVQPGDLVHVMVKKGPAGESVGVWRADDR